MQQLLQNIWDAVRMRYLAIVQYTVLFEDGSIKKSHRESKHLPFNFNVEWRKMLKKKQGSRREKKIQFQWRERIRLLKELQKKKRMKTETLIGGN